MIEVKQLTKHFGPIKAVQDVSFTVEKGDILGFLGPNGAGKSTTMRMITSYIPPTSGTAVVGGHDILDDALAARRKIGYLSETVPVYPDMTVTGFLSFCAEARGIYGAEKKRKVADIIEKCFLQSVIHQSVGTLSKGYRQRVCFAQSIIHDPEYLIMDEPTDGLDPNQKHEVRQMIRNMSGQKAIILSTHILDEVEAVCNRAVIIAGGRIIADETPEKLKEKSDRHNTVSAVLKNADKSAITSRIRGITGVKEVILSPAGNGETTLTVRPEDPRMSVSGPVGAALNELHVEIRLFREEEGRLDDVFRLLTANGSN